MDIIYYYVCVCSQGGTAFYMFGDPLVFEPVALEEAYNYSRLLVLLNFSD